MNGNIYLTGFSSEQLCKTILKLVTKLKQPPTTAPSINICCVINWVILYLSFLLCIISVFFNLWRTSKLVTLWFRVFLGCTYIFTLYRLLYCVYVQNIIKLLLDHFYQLGVIFSTNIFFLLHCIVFK